MTAPRRNPAAGIAVALAALAATPAFAQSQDAARTIANGESIVIDGRTFGITPGASKNDVLTPAEQRGARPLGAGVIIFRSGGGLYMVDRAPPRPAATTAPRAETPRNSAVECGRGSGIRDEGAYSNEECQRAAGLPDASTDRRPPFGMRETGVGPQRPNGLGVATTAPDDIADMAGNPRIHVEYQTPKDPAQQQVYDAIKQRHVLEMVRKIFSPFMLGDINLNIRTVSCGVSNAWYQRIDNVPTVSICYEYLQEIWQSMPEETKELKDSVTMKDAICGQLFFAVAHELGHAMFDIFDVPVFGRQEDAADEFATYIMLQFGGEQSLRLIDGAAFGYHAYVKDLKEKPEVTLPLAAFSSDHGSPEERYFNLICIAYGYDDRLFAGEMDKIPPGRARNCKFEYADLKFAMHTVFWPHLDHDKVRRVLAMKWFTGPDANTSMIKAN